MITLSHGNDIIQGIGISLLSSGLVSAVSTFFSISEDSKKTVNDWGLEHVYMTRGEMNSSCDEYLSRSKNLKAIGFGFRSLRDSQEGRIISMLRKGGNVKLITMKPDCPALKLREEDERQKISDSISELLEWAKELNGMNLPGKIEVRWHEHLPSDFVFILDNRLFNGPYEYGKLSQQTISFEYNITGTAYEYHEAYFDQLWNDKSYCANALE